MITNKNLEKNNLFKHSVLIGAALLISLGCQLVFSFILIALGFNQEQINDLLTDTWSGYLLNTLLSVLSLTFPFLILKKLNNECIADLCKFNKPRTSHTYLCIFFAVGLSFSANYVTSIFNEVLKRVFDFEATQPMIGDNEFSDPFELIFTIVCVGAIPALVEEFAFRGFILNTLRKFGDWPAILVSALLFGILHGNFIQIPFAFIVGIGLGVITVITNSIWPAVCAHFINNTYAVLSNAYTDDNQFIYLFVFYLFIALAIFSFIILLKNGYFKLIKSQPSELSAFSKTIRMILSPTVIIFIVFMMFTALLSRVV